MMKNKCFLLLKAQLSNEFGKKNKSKGRTLTTAAIAFVAVVMVAYAFLLSYGLGSIGMASVIPSYAMAITSLIMLFFTVIKANGVLFAYKEYDFLMSLPVKTSTVITSRFLAMYSMNLLLTAAVMLSMGAGYVIWETPGILFYVQWILGTLAIPLVPTTLASMLGALVILFSSRFRYANAVVTILSLALVVGVLALTFGMGGMQESDFDLTRLQSMGAFLLDGIHKIYPPAVLFYEGVVNNQPLPMLAFLLGSVLWYGLFLLAVSAVYKKVNTSLMTFHARSNYQLTELKTSSQLSALYQKERKRFFSSSIYCLNTGMGSILVIVFSVALLFFDPETLNQFFKTDEAWDLVERVIPFAIGAFLSMTCTTAVSLSLEGKNLWIIKSLPVQAETVFKSKILWNLTLQIPTALIAALLINIRFPLSPIMRALTFLTPVACALLNSVGGMFINLKMPEYGWTSETTLIKQSLPSMAGMLGGLVAGLLPVIALVLLKDIDAGLVTSVLTVLIAAGAFALWQYIRKQEIPV